MRILVTGGAGFIGSHVCEALLERKDEVICVDNFNDYYVSQCGSRFSGWKERNVAAALKQPGYWLVRADICERNPIETAFRKKVDVVVHLAARAGVRASFQDSKTYYNTNVEGTRNVIEAAFARGVRKFVIASSSSVYGTNSKTPFSETDPVDNTISPYAQTKKEMEAVCRQFQKAHPETKFTVLRFFTVYGPRGRPDMAPFKFVDLISQGTPVTRYGDGTSLRDYTFVADIVEGILRAIEQPFPFEIINLGNNKPVALNKFIATVEAAVGKKAKIIRQEAQQGDMPVTYADITKAKRLLDWEPRVSVEDGMKKLVEWYRTL